MEAALIRFGAPWRLVLLALVVASLATAPWSWFVDGLTPSFIVYPLVLLIGLWRMRKGGGTLYFGIGAGIFLLVHVPWAWSAFTGELAAPLPEDVAIHRFTWTVTLFAVPLLTAVAGFRASQEAKSRQETT
jgi:hypothetical protein